MFRKRLVSIMVVTLTVVVGYDSAGVPLVQFTSTISSVGPDFDAALAVTRCAGVS